MANAHAVWGATLAPRRVGLIGSGWYGKADLLRLIQVEPVEVVSLCDVDKAMLTEAGDLVASRQKSKKVPRLYGDYRKMLAEKDLDLVRRDVGHRVNGKPSHRIESYRDQERRENEGQSPILE